MVPDRNSMLEILATSSVFGGAQHWESLQAMSPLPHLAEFAIRVLSKSSGVGDVERFHNVMKHCVNPVARKSMSFENVERQMADDDTAAAPAADVRRVQLAQDGHRL